MLTPEKIEEIKNQLTGLEPDAQQEKLREILEDLSPEEQEQLVGKRECPFCLMGEGKIPVKKVYEDDTIIGVLDINPATKGHILLFPKKHAAILATVEDSVVEKLFVVANKLATAVFDELKCAGTNIVVANGPAAGQTSPHVIVNIIPRYEDDKVSISWDHTQADEGELEALSSQLFGKVAVVASKKVAPAPVQKAEDDDGNYQKVQPRIP
jgi:histidine triad (HIT) family protein